MHGRFVLVTRLTLCFFMLCKVAHADNPEDFQQGVRVLQNPVLTPGSSTLALSVHCLPGSSCTTTQHAALTGAARRIVIQNTGSVHATNLTTKTAGLPAGTSITANTCRGTLKAGDSCTVTLTPGTVASSDAKKHPCTRGTQPVAGAVKVSADGGIFARINIYVLGYGCMYQGGFLFSVDDTTQNTGNIGGKVLSPVNQAFSWEGHTGDGTGVIWSSNGEGAAARFMSDDLIPFISDTPSGATYDEALSVFNGFYSNTATYPFPAESGFLVCDGLTDGACNTDNILLFYKTLNTGWGIGNIPFTLSPGPTNPDYYAAGLCTRVINGSTDWYLPAICEINEQQSDLDKDCPEQMQSISANLSFLFGDNYASDPATSCNPPQGTECIAGYYWSSTESPGLRDTNGHAWFAYFLNLYRGYLTSSYAGPKRYELGVRCARSLT